MNWFLRSNPSKEIDRIIYEGTDEEKQRLRDRILVMLGMLFQNASTEEERRKFKDVIRGIC